MKSIKYAALAVGMLVGASANAAICSHEGKVVGIIPSAGVASFTMDVPLTGCACDHDVIWIDTNADSGKAMYSAVLAAKMAGKTVKPTFEDGLGEGAPGNLSVTYRHWGSCKLQAFEIY